jgi:hypothetical protein
MSTRAIHKQLLLIVITALCTVLVGCVPTASPTAPPTQPPQNGEPIEIVSVSGPLRPFTPGGPTVEITLKNVADTPVVSLDATLELSRPFEFGFEVSSAMPLLPDASVSARLTLIAAGFDDSTLYPLTVHGTMPDATTFAFTTQVQLLEPPAG